MIALASVLVGVLFATGVYAMLSRNLQRIAIGFLLLSNGVNLMVLTAAGLASRASAPLLHGTAAGPFADPLPQAFVLTAIVIGLGTAAFLLAMAVGIHRESGGDELPREGP